MPPPAAKESTIFATLDVTFSPESQPNHCMIMPSAAPCSSARASGEYNWSSVSRNQGDPNVTPALAQGPDRSRSDRPGRPVLPGLRSAIRKRVNPGSVLDPFREGRYPREPQGFLARQRAGTDSSTHQTENALAANDETNLLGISGFRHDSISGVILNPGMTGRHPESARYCDLWQVRRTKRRSRRNDGQCQDHLRDATNGPVRPSVPPTRSSDRRLLPRSKGQL